MNAVILEYPGILLKLNEALIECKKFLPQLPSNMLLPNKDALIGYVEAFISIEKENESRIRTEEIKKLEESGAIEPVIPDATEITSSSDVSEFDSTEVISIDSYPSEAAEDRTDIEEISIDVGDETRHEEEILINVEPVELKTEEVSVSNTNKDAAISDEVKRQVDFDTEMLDIFIEEADDLIGEIDSALTRLESNSTDMDSLREVQRAMHTLKGGANMCGASYLGELTHTVETMLERVEEGVLDASDKVLACILEVHDATQEMVDDLRNGKGLLPQSELAKKVEAFTNGDEYIAPSVVDIPLSTVEEAETVELPTIDIQSVSSEVEATDEVPVVQEQGEEIISSEAEIEDAKVAEGLISEERIDDTTASRGPESWSDKASKFCEPQSDYDVEMFNDAFREEADELCENLDSAFQALQKNDHNTETLQLIQRYIHTLKGGANMLSLSPIGEVSHELENIFEKINEGIIEPDENIVNLCFIYYDVMTDMLDMAKAQESVPYADELTSIIKTINDTKDASAVRLYGTGEATHKADISVEAGPEKALATEEELHGDLGVVGKTEAEPVSQQAKQIVDMAKAASTSKTSSSERRSGTRKEQEQVKVRVEVLSDITNVSGELLTSNSRIEQQHNRVMFNMSEMDQVIDRFSDKLRQFSIETESQMQATKSELQDKYGEEFDALEMDRFSNVQTLSRSLIESLHDIVSIKSMVEETGKDLDTLLLQQSRLQGELQNHLVRARTLPFSSHIPRLRKLVRKVSGDTGKKAELRIVGADEELDRALLDKIMGPMEHLLRNAIDHGMETPDQRQKTDKPEVGTVKITVSKEGQEGVITVADDGKGIHTEKVKQKAVALGLMTEDKEMSRQEIIQFILHPGFSTAENVTQISGRGVGMDVVNSEIRLMGGRLNIASEEGKGTSFEIRLPLTLAVNRALLVGIDDSVFAIPIAVIDGIVYASKENVVAMYDNPSLLYEYNNASYEFHYLGSLLGISSPTLTDDIKKVPMALVRAGERRIALHVNSLFGNREIVAKPLAKQISTVKGISGATIMGDGRVVMIVDMAAIIRANVLEDQEIDSKKDEILTAQSKAPTIMVVDDSITIRKVSQRVLVRNGFEVRLAKDGFDALSQLHEDGLPDVMLLDIEMPRMDGFELAQTVLNDAKMKNLPIIMITSRTGEKHKARAYEIGVKKYLGKPFVEDELIGSINELLEQSHTASVN